MRSNNHHRLVTFCLFLRLLVSLIGFGEATSSYASEFDYRPEYHPSRNPGCPTRWVPGTRDEPGSQDEGGPVGEEPSIEIRAVLLRCPKADTETYIKDVEYECTRWVDVTANRGPRYDVTAERREDIRKFQGFDSDENPHRYEVNDCRRKLIITMKLNNAGKTRTKEEFVVVDHVSDPVTMQKARLLNPLVIKIRQEQILQLYGLKFRSVVNAEATEEVINKNSANYTGCDVSSDNPTCGQMMFEGKVVPHSEGFCCSCDGNSNEQRQESEDLEDFTSKSSIGTSKSGSSEEDEGSLYENMDMFARLFGNSGSSAASTIPSGEASKSGSENRNNSRHSSETGRVSHGKKNEPESGDNEAFYGNGSVRRHKNFRVVRKEGRKASERTRSRGVSSLEVVDDVFRTFPVLGIGKSPSRGKLEAYVEAVESRALKAGAEVRRRFALEAGIPEIESLESSPRSVFGSAVAPGDTDDSVGRKQREYQTTKKKRHEPVKSARFPRGRTDNFVASVPKREENFHGNAEQINLEEPPLGDPSSVTESSGIKFPTVRRTATKRSLEVFSPFPAPSSGTRSNSTKERSITEDLEAKKLQATWNSSSGTNRVNRPTSGSNLPLILRQELANDKLYPSARSSLAKTLPGGVRRSGLYPKAAINYHERSTTALAYSSDTGHDPLAGEDSEKLLGFDTLSGEKKSTRLASIEAPEESMTVEGRGDNDFWVRNEDVLDDRRTPPPRDRVTRRRVTSEFGNETRNEPKEYDDDYRIDDPRRYLKSHLANDSRLKAMSNDIEEAISNDKRSNDGAMLEKLNEIDKLMGDGRDSWERSSRSLPEDKPSRPEKNAESDLEGRWESHDREVYNEKSAAAGTMQRTRTELADGFEATLNGSPSSRPKTVDESVKIISGSGEDSEYESRMKRNSRDKKTCYPRSGRSGIGRKIPDSRRRKKRRCTSSGNGIEGGENNPDGDPSGKDGDRRAGRRLLSIRDSGWSEETGPEEYTDPRKSRSYVRRKNEAAMRNFVRKMNEIASRSDSGGAEVVEVGEGAKREKDGKTVTANEEREENRSNREETSKKVDDRANPLGLGGCLSVKNAENIPEACDEEKTPADAQSREGSVDEVLSDCDSNLGNSRTLIFTDVSRLKVIALNVPVAIDLRSVDGTNGNVSTDDPSMERLSSPENDLRENKVESRVVDLTHQGRSNCTEGNEMNSGVAKSDSLSASNPTDDENLSSEAVRIEVGPRDVRGSNSETENESKGQGNDRLILEGREAGEKDSNFAASLENKSSRWNVGKRNVGEKRSSRKRRRKKGCEVENERKEHERNEGASEENEMNEKTERRENVKKKRYTNAKKNERKKRLRKEKDDETRASKRWPSKRKLLSFSGESDVPRGRNYEKSRSRRQFGPDGVQIRGGQDCANGEHPPDVDPEKYQESAHCLRFSDLWYSVYELETPFVEHTLYLQLFEKHTRPDGTTRWDDLTRGSMVRLGTFVRHQRDNGATIAFTYTGAKLSPEKQTSNLNSEKDLLLVPSPIPYRKLRDDPELGGGSGEYIVIGSKDVEMGGGEGKGAGNECDKAGVGFAAFARQPNRCERPRGSCLKNQPLAFRRHDTEAREAGKTGCYFLSNFASVPNNPIKYNVSGAGSREYLALEYHSNHVSTIDVEARSDYNAIVRVGSSGRVTEVYVDSTHLEHTLITIAVSNTGLASSPYQPRINDCPTGLPVSWNGAGGAMQIIPPQHDHRVTLDLSGKLSLNDFHCSVEVVNHRGELVATRRIRVRKMDRCFCVWQCLCACVGDVMGLGCQPMSPEHYHAAGFQGAVPFANLEPSIMSETIRVATMYAGGYLLCLFGLGTLKWLVGILVPAVSRCGLEVLLEGTVMVSYYEEELRNRSIVTNDDGAVVHPDTGERSVRICSRRDEFLLNLTFFLVYPIAVCCNWCATDSFTRSEETRSSNDSEIRSAGEKNIDGKFIEIDTYNDENDSFLEAEDTKYVIDELQRSRDSIEQLGNFDVTLPNPK